MASPLDSLAQYVASDLHLGTLGTDIFEDYYPDDPDAIITIYDTGGRPPTLVKGDDTDYPSFQMRARSLDPVAALAKLATIFQALHGLTETTLHNTHFKLVFAKQSNPATLGRDEKQRFQFTQNYGAAVRGVNR